MSNIDPNEGLLNALGYKDIEEIPGSAGRTIKIENLDNADPNTKVLILLYLDQHYQDFLF